MTDRTDLDQVLEQADQAARQQRFAAAGALVDRALELAPDDLRVLDLAGFVRFFEGRFSDCETLCRRALELDPDRVYAVKGLGLAVARQGRLDEGVALLERAVRLKPQWLDPRWDLAVALFEGGRIAQALAVMREAEPLFISQRPRILAFIDQMQAARDRDQG